MKRVLTTLLVVALVGSLLFAGFAGTAAAHSDDKKDDKHHDDKHHDDKHHDDKHHDDKDANDGDNGDNDANDGDNGDNDANDGDNGDNDANDGDNGDNDANDGDTQKAAQGAAIEQKSSAEVTQVQESYQANVNEDDQTAVALSYHGVAAASNDVTQSNVNVQAASATSFNAASIDQDVDQDD